MIIETERLLIRGSRRNPNAGLMAASAVPVAEEKQTQMRMAFDPNGKLRPLGSSGTATPLKTKNQINPSINVIFNYRNTII